MDEPPLEIFYLHDMFYDLFNTEGITWSEVYYYQQVADIELDAFELSTIKRATAACAKWMRKTNKPKESKNSNKSSSSGKGASVKPKPRRR